MIRNVNVLGGGGGAAEGGLGEVKNIHGRAKFPGLGLKRIPASCIDLQVFTIRTNFKMG